MSNDYKSLEHKIRDILTKKLAESRKTVSKPENIQEALPLIAAAPYVIPAATTALRFAAPAIVRGAGAAIRFGKEAAPNAQRLFTPANRNVVAAPKPIAPGAPAPATAPAPVTIPATAPAPVRTPATAPAPVRTPGQAQSIATKTGPSKRAGPRGRDKNKTDKKDRRRRRIGFDLPSGSFSTDPSHFAAQVPVKVIKGAATARIVHEEETATEIRSEIENVSRPNRKSVLARQSKIQKEIIDENTRRDEIIRRIADEVIKKEKENRVKVSRGQATGRVVHNKKKNLLVDTKPKLRPASLDEQETLSRLQQVMQQQRELGFRQSQDEKRKEKLAARMREFRQQADDQKPFQGPPQPEPKPVVFSPTTRTKDDAVTPTPTNTGKGDRLSQFVGNAGKTRDDAVKPKAPAPLSDTDPRLNFSTDEKPMSVGPSTRSVPLRTPEPELAVGPSQRLGTRKPFEPNIKLPDTAPVPTQKPEVSSEPNIKLPDTAPVPTQRPTAAAQSKYKIASGDTLSRLAKMNNVSIDDILKANPSIKDPNRIRAGAEIILPKK